MASYFRIAKQFPQFKREEIDEFIMQFRSFDTDNSGAIDENELMGVMRNLGETTNRTQIKKLIAEVDIDGDGEIQFNEFLAMIDKIRSGQSSSTQGMARVYTKQASIIRIQGAVEGGSHSFADDEKESFVNFINSTLYNDPDLQEKLPINPTSMDIFPALQDGILLCKLINDAVPDTVDERVLNKRKLNKFTMIENQNLAINSAKAIGCNVVNVGHNDIMESNVYLLLGLLWQIIRIGLLRKISLTEHPELYRLLLPGETLEDLLKLSPDQILLRWLNYHLKNAGSNRVAKNFGSDIRDSEIYTTVMTQLSKQCTTNPMKFSDPHERAEKMLQEAEKIDCRRFVSPNDVASGNPKLNLAFVANMFNTLPGLEPLTEEEKAALDEWLFASEGDREAKTYSIWLNSMGVEPFVNNIFINLRDGLILLQAFDKIEPGCVNWKKVSKNPRNKFQTLQNVNYVVEIGQKLGFSMVGIQGSDIYDGNKTLTLGLVWQMMRHNVVTILKKVGGGRSVSDRDMLNWANKKNSGAGKRSKINSFNDPNISTGHFFLDLCDAMKPGCIDNELVTPGTNDEDALMNAKYIISVARKIGASIFLLPEDIVEIKAKMILTLVGSLMAVDYGV